MGRGPLYSDEQREAIISAVLEDGLSARQAVEKASLGGLGLAAFEMPVSTAQGIVRQAKHRGTRDRLSDRLAQGADRLLSVAEREIADVENLKAESDGDHLKARRAADLLVRVQKLVNAMDLGAEPNPPDSETDEASATQMTDDDSVRKLLEVVRRRQAEKEQVAPQTQAGHSEPDAEPRRKADEIRADPDVNRESAAEQRARERAELARELGIDSEQTQTQSGAGVEQN